MPRNSKRPSADKRMAAVCYVSHGTFEGAAAVCGVPATTIRTWAEKDSVFREYCNQAEQEHGAELKSAFAAIVRHASEEALDRIQNGDWSVDPKTGASTRTPMRGRDLTLCAAIFYDKMRLIGNQPTSISASIDLNALAESFARLAQGPPVVAVQRLDRQGDG